MISLTEAAATKLKKIIKKNNILGIRPAVQGGGCSGFTYKLEFANEENPRDKLILDKGVNLYVDPKSYLYLMGTEIDYVDTINESGFKFSNPK